MLTREEVRQVFTHLRGEAWRMASLLYGSGSRLKECLSLRVQDIDFGRRNLVVRDGKGVKDRVTMLPSSLINGLEGHLEHVVRCTRKT